MIVIGSVIASGTDPSAGGGVKLPHRVHDLLAPGDDRRPVADTAPDGAGGPREPQVDQRVGDLVRWR